MSVWLAKYRWLFFAATFILLAVAFYFTFKDHDKTKPRNLRFLFGTTALSVSLIAYSFITN